MNDKTIQRVIVVEDDPEILYSLRLILSDEGYDVDCVTTGKELNDFLMKKKFNLILLDHRLKDEQGDMITRSLKSSPLTSHIPIIIMSASQQAKQSAFAAGADNFLDKPFEIDSLLSLIKLTLDAR